MDNRVQFLRLLRWPIDLSVFCLAFGYGVVRFLEAIFGPAIPGWAIFIACLTLTFISTLAVQRYMPSDEQIEHINSKTVIIWINVSMLISGFMPILSTVFAQTALFWLVLLLSVAARSLLTLELWRLESSGQDLSDEAIITKKFLFKPRPDAYALAPLPTALLFSCMVAGIIGYRLLGIAQLQFLLPLSAIFYVILSTIARAISLRKQRTFSSKKELQSIIRNDSTNDS